MDIKSMLSSYFGTISDEEKEEVYAEVNRGSNPSREYFIMLVISAIIATIGLLTNNVSVIIGAMLVSPLLLPVIGISLGAVKGDFFLFRTALEAEAKGIFIVFILVSALTLFIPTASITSEVLVRTHPTPLDLLVALASGAAAAYALAKKNLSVALPGVAIAVAVMPPLCAVGIGFALRRPDVALGAALTFLANVVAINFAASVIFWLLEFSPHWSLSDEKETMNKLKTSAMLLLLILVPLAWIMWNSFNEENTSSVIRQVISSQLDGIVGAKLSSFSFEQRKDGAIAIFATIDSPVLIDENKAKEIQAALEKNLKSDVALSLSVNEVKLLHVERAKDRQPS